MTWLDRIENTTFTIRTGDGKLFYPSLPIGYETSKEFNAMQFEFINVEGALVNRRKVKARNFPLNFFFTGEDNIDQAADFDLSCNDNRAWTVRHPMYGDITGQPISIKRGDANLNATQFSVDFWETITTQNPVATIAPDQSIYIRVGSFSTISPVDYSSKVAIKPADVSKITVQANSIIAFINKAATFTSDTYADYQKLQYNMFNAIDNMAADSATGIESIQQVILQPALLEMNVKDRINLFIAIYNNALTMLSSTASANDKAYVEAVGAMAIAAAALASVNPLATDYPTRDQINQISDILTGLYQDYLVTLDAAYVPIGNPGASFSTSQQTQNSLQDIIFQTIIGLQTLAFNAKVERFVTLATDSQLIVLTHKYLGLDAADQNIETFRTINNLKNNSLFLVPKGTEIKYYA